MISKYQCSHIYSNNEHFSWHYLQADILKLKFEFERVFFSQRETVGPGSNFNTHRPPNHKYDMNKIKLR